MKLASLIDIKGFLIFLLAILCIVFMSGCEIFPNSPPPTGRTGPGTDVFGGERWEKSDWSEEVGRPQGWKK